WATGGWRGQERRQPVGRVSAQSAGSAGAPDRRTVEKPGRSGCEGGERAGVGGAGGCLAGLRGRGLLLFEGFLRGGALAAGPGSPVAALPAARGVLCRPGCSCVVGGRPVGRRSQRTVAIVEPEPAGLPPGPARPGGALPGLSRPAAV